jgi:hypothetical protein
MRKEATEWDTRKMDAGGGRGLGYAAHIRAGSSSRLVWRRLRENVK